MILIFDNELENNKKPLYNFINHVNFASYKDNLKQELKIKLFDNRNLFLVTNPLVNGKKECEIEDLFTRETLDQKINGKTFSQKDGYNTETHYGKEIFSNYISKNYDKINFNGFRKLLDNLNAIIES